MCLCDRSVMVLYKRKDFKITEIYTCVTCNVAVRIWCKTVKIMCLLLAPYIRLGI